MIAIPQSAINALLRLGFRHEHGYINVDSSRYGLSRKEYQMRHGDLEIYLMCSLMSTWFYDASSLKFIHPDLIHEHLYLIQKTQTQ